MTQDLREHLVANRIAGAVNTPRENNLAAMRRLAAGDERTWFGLAPRRMDLAEVLAVMAARAGVHPDPAYAEGPDTIDPDRTVDRLAAMRQRLAKAARNREAVFVASGHPAGVLAIHLPVAQALREAGCAIRTPLAGERFTYAEKRRELRYVGGVGVVSDRGELNHTHSADPMRRILADGLDAGLVVADHGWAGAAAEAGHDVVCFADCNDPALFLGEEQRKVGVCVPLDDNVLPHLYQPVTDYLLADLR